MDVLTAVATAGRGDTDAPAVDHADRRAPVLGDDVVAEAVGAIGRSAGGKATRFVRGP